MDILISGNNPQNQRGQIHYDTYHDIIEKLEGIIPNDTEIDVIEKSDDTANDTDKG